MGGGLARQHAQVFAQESLVLPETRKAKFWHQELPRSSKPGARQHNQNPEPESGFGFGLFMYDVKE